MPYATATDLTDRYGASALVLAADRDGDGVADTAAVDRALADATGEVDSYIAARYPVPLAAPLPSRVVQVTVDIAFYRLCREAGSYTEEIRQRYDDALAWLRDVARGIATLGQPAEAPAASAGDVQFESASPSVFGRADR